MKKIYFLLFTLLPVFAFAQVQIGTDTNQFQDGPFDPSNVYSYSQSIYLAPEINASGNITELQWYFSGTTLLPNSQDLSVYLGHTTKTEFSSTSDWELITNLTQVYTGGIDVSAGEGWITIVFDTPFAYNGLDNLVIAVDENMEGSDNFADDFYNSPVANPRTITYRSFSTNPDPASPPTANAGTDSYVPNVIIGGITQTCPVPTDGIALSTSTTEASLDWTLGGSETLWDIELGEAGFAPAGTPTETGIAKPYSAIGLTANTAYEFYVRADCTGGDLSAWNGPFSFRTACVPIDDFSENFESMPDELEVPYCWNTILSTTGSVPSTKVNSSSFSAFEGDNYFEISSLTNDDMVYLVSPESSIIADGNQRIEFAAKSGFLGSESITLKVGLMTDANDENTFIELTSFDLTNSSENNNNYTIYAVNIPLNVSSNYLAFVAETTSTSNKTVYLDDIVVSAQPTCFQVLDVTANNITDASFDLDLTLDIQTQTEWEFTVKQTTTDYDPSLETPIVATTLSTNITTDSDASAIIANSTYLVYARANCDAAGSDGSGLSDWFGPFELRTGCAAIIDDFSENFDGLPDDLVTPYCWTTMVSSTGTDPDIKVNSSTSQSYSPDNYYEISSFVDEDTVFLVSPESSIISDGTHRVEFAAKVNSTSGGDTNLKVGLMSDPNNEATFIELSSFTLTSSSSNTNNYTLYYVNVPLNVTHNYLAIKPETSATFSKTIYLDDVLVTTQPSCFDVLDVTATNIADTSFDLNLSLDFQTQTEWEYIIKQTDLNFNPDLETTATTNSPVVSGITEDTDGGAIISNSIYRVFVRANCDAAGSDGSGMSPWFGPYEFRTACAPVGEGFTENFDSYVNGDFPFCWYKNVESTGSPLVQVSSFSGYPNSDPNTLLMNTGNDPSANILLVLPQNTVANDGAHRLEFFARKSNANTEANIVVGTMADPFDANTFAEITSVPIITGGSSGDAVQYYVNLPENTDEYVVLKHGAGTGSSIGFYIDDVTITDQPACPEVYNITAENITASSVEVSWEFVGGQTNWEYIVQATDTGEPTSGTETNSNTLNADFNALDANTTYEIYVRADCDTDGTSPWVGPVNFTTACVPEFGTYSHGFEGFISNDEIAPCWSSLIDPSSTSPYVKYSNLQAQDGTISVRLYSGNDETSGIFLVTPMLSDLDNTKQIVFQVYDDNNGGLEVGTMTDPTNAATFTSYETYLDADMTDDAWDEKVLNFDGFTGSDQYIAFKFNAATTFDSLYIDNFTYQTDPTLGVGDFNFENAVKIYPNPVKNILNISGNNIDAVEVFSLNGKRILTQNSNMNSVDVSALANGMYFINVIGNKGSTTVKKFVKQ